MKITLHLKRAIPLLAAACAAFAFQAANPAETARWERQARNVNIVRDDWGIAHIYGKTDADAVFGMIYAQAEDDFNRVETNYLNSMGRLAESEGESKIYQDLRMKLFIDPADLKKQYAASPPWLQALMNAWADGLNFYLAKHPDVKPLVDSAIRALDGAELHRRQHRRRHREGEPERAASVLRQGCRGAGGRTATSRRRSPRDRTAWRSRLRIPPRIMRCC